MAAGSNAFFSQQYATAVELYSQQVRPKVAMLATPMTAVGRAATVVNFVDQVDAPERGALYVPITFQSPTHIRPWVFPRHFHSAVPFDSYEQMQMEANPESTYVEAVVAALNRDSDAETIRAFFADRLIGETGGTTDSFDTAMQVAVTTGGAAACGMNLEKVQAALEILRTKEIDTRTEQLHCVIAPKQERQLMNEMEVTSSDFTIKRILDAGTMEGSNYMGINWVISNFLLTDGSSYRRVPFFTTKGMSYCQWNAGPETNISQRDDLAGQPWQVYAKRSCGAVRRDGRKVVEIKCSES